VKGFEKRVEETGPKNVEAKKEIQVGAAAITTHRVPELNLLAASTWMAFFIPARPMQQDGDGPPNALKDAARTLAFRLQLYRSAAWARTLVVGCRPSLPIQRASAYTSACAMWYGHAFAAMVSALVRPLPLAYD
jgi:hypothetical protein